MFFISLLNCAIVFTLTQHRLVQCNFNANNNRTPSNGSVAATSSIRNGGERGNVTFNDKSRLFADSENRGENFDKSQNKREFPSSAKRKRNLDTPYHDSDNSSDYDDGVKPASSSDVLPDCILSRSEFYLSWWVSEDGSLKLPASNRTGNSLGFIDLSFKVKMDNLTFQHIMQLTTENPNDVITFMSLANNELSRFPGDILNIVNISLQYLSLANNNFNYLFDGHEETFQTWSGFPLMGNLKELDLRNCSLTRLEDDIFSNLPKLEKLFLSHNMLVELKSLTFTNLRNLNHLDLSYNKQDLGLSYNINPLSYLISGLSLDEGVFSYLSNLIFLDLSHTKLKKESVLALETLGEKVEQLSLCYTDIPLIITGMFEGTNLKVLDLSGNPSLSTQLDSTWFQGLEKKLEILIFEQSKINLLQPLRHLSKLRMLSLGNNNIKEITALNFKHFSELEILDLNNNHLRNWYETVFSQNTRLKIVNLRNNNINLITEVMMKDFNQIRFLAIGSNNFVCNCSLREFIDRATFNARVYACRTNISRQKRSSHFPSEFNDPAYQYDVFLREYHNYISYLDNSFTNMIGGETFVSNKRKSNAIDVDIPITVDAITTTSCNGVFDEPESVNDLSFEFILLDYNENDYHCIESNKSSTSKVFFSDIPTCFNQVRPSDAPYPDVTSTDGGEMVINDDDENIHGGVKNLRTPRNILIVYVSVGFPLTLIGALWFWKRKDIRYFCSIFKNTLILSFDKDDQKALMMTNRRKSNSNDDHYRFDLFVSYSDNDREFVLDQLIPNLEKRSEITICLHERDFQVGLGILENIIQCMDQSRCLLLVVSESFLKSNWCSFEMHLAQHRLIETRREQLILVLLQDIPKARRPRTLTFLMRTKTYIMWPKEDKEELRNIFWRRLKKAIVLNNWEPESVHRKPRHSIV